MSQAEYLQCPLCGWVRPINYGYGKYGKREVRFDKMDLGDALIWQLRELSGAGRGSVNAKISLIEGKTLKEIPEYIKKQIINQCTEILNILK